MKFRLLSGWEQKSQSMFWMLLWSVSFCIVMISNRLVSAQSSIFLIVWMRSFFAFVVLIPFFLSQRKSLWTDHWKVQLLRGSLIFGAMVCNYLAYRILPMASVAALGMSGPLLINVLGALVLKESIPKKRWNILGIGYMGVLFLVKPQNFVFQTAMLLPLMGNMCVAFALTFAKKLTRTETDVSLLFYGSLVPFLLSSLGALTARSIPQFSDGLYFILIGIFGGFSQFCYLQALKVTSPAFASSFEYVRLCLFLPIGYLLFDEVPDFLSLLGVLCIVISTVLLSHTSKVEKPQF
jgi:drug/metabolite transporter (DMT)-like permease